MKKVILLIEDDEHFSKVLKMHLEKRKHRIHIAKDGESGLEMASKLSPDIILLDVMLPGMDGYQTCLELKADAKTKGIPVVMLTGKTKMDSVEKAFEMGADDYVIKSRPLFTLLAIIDDKIRKYTT